MSSGDLSLFFSTFSYSPETIDKYKRSLIDFFSSFSSLSSVSSVDFLNWLNSHKTWGSSATWIAYCAVRKFISWKFGSYHPLLNCRIKRGNSGPQRTFNKIQLLTLLSYFDTSSIKGKRDLAICSLLCDTGLRASEICRLDLKYLKLKNRSAYVITKGGGWDKCVFSYLTSLYLNDWLGARKLIARSNINTVFVSLSGIRPGTSLTREGLQILVRKWGQRSGIGKLSPHDFRRSFATISIQAGAPTRLVQVAGRWSDLKMVELYTSTIDAADMENWFPINVVMR